MSTCNYLSLSWSVSRGRDTYGYNICRLYDRNNDRRFRCLGGGYDMVGTVFAQWLTETYQAELITLKDRAHYVVPLEGTPRTASQEDSFYGMTYHEKGDRVYLNGACGLDCMIRIAAAIGLEVERDYIQKGKRRGETVGWFISEKESADTSL